MLLTRSDCTPTLLWLQGGLGAFSLSKGRIFERMCQVASTVVVLANANNGLVAQLHLDQIAPGVLRLLLGQPEAEKRLPFAAFTLLVKSVVLLLSAGQAWAWRRLLSGRSNIRGLV
jgi:hypothetical protein